MKVVLFCGGLGMRLREYAKSIPKPLVPIGLRPVMWHLMRYYAHFGHKDFIVCLGYLGDAVREYFRTYTEHVGHDGPQAQSDGLVDRYTGDISDWTITFAETGPNSNIGERLTAIREHVAGEELFLANYADGLTDLHLPHLIDFAQAQNRIATFMSVRPSLSYHLVSADGDGVVRDIHEMSHSEIRINGGFFAFRQEMFDYIRSGEELVKEPFQRLIRERQLAAYAYDGFFASMDTFKDKQLLDDLCAGGQAPWQVWRHLGARV